MYTIHCIPAFFVLIAYIWTKTIQSSILPTKFNIKPSPEFQCPECVGFMLYVCSSQKKSWIEFKIDDFWKLVQLCSFKNNGSEKVKDVPESHFKIVPYPFFFLKFGRFSAICKQTNLSYFQINRWNKKEILENWAIVGK